MRRTAVMTLAMKNTNPEVRLAALRSLAKVGPKAEEAAEELLPQLTKEMDPFVRIELSKTLQRILPPSHKAQPKLRQLEVAWQYAALLDRLRKLIDRQEQLSK